MKTVIAVLILMLCSLAYSQEQKLAFPMALRDYNPPRSPILIGISNIQHSDPKNDGWYEDIKVIENQTDLDCIEEQKREINHIAELLGKSSDMPEGKQSEISNYLDAANIGYFAVRFRDATKRVDQSPYNPDYVKVESVYSTYAPGEVLASHKVQVNANLVKKADGKFVCQTTKAEVIIQALTPYLQVTSKVGAHQRN
jgi:hypothetical protein